MKNDIYFAIPILICIGLAIFFLIKWFVTFTGIKKINIFTMIKEGMKGLSYIMKDNPDFNEYETRKLNRFLNLTYLFILSGMAIIIVKMILG